MRVSQRGYDLIKHFEGLSLDAYKDPGSVSGLPITIGYGTTMRKDGTRFQLGDTITQEEAQELLEWWVDRKATIINTMLLNVHINQNQFDALVSFAYNVGIGGLNSSTLLKKVKINPLDPSIEHEFMRWNKAGGKTLKGLTERRRAEYHLYKTYNETISA